ncbi:MAG TPA: FAD-dependent oxidoreductase [Syntrophales bacterium]|nr:FAD-dependent oxidoreductase [Syntrophales bacterium]HQN77287.1 FAD-dependent oxidoreductase [Syntrophales bacterium]
MDKLEFSSWNGKVVDNRKGKAKKASRAAAVPFPVPVRGEKAAAVMGWNGLVVLEPGADVPSLTVQYLTEIRKISCGECSVCMIGIDMLLDIFKDMADGEGFESDLAEIEKIVRDVAANAKCNFGQSALFPVSDAVKHYRADFVAVVKGDRKIDGKAYGTAVTAPCIEACPASLDIPGYIEYIRNNRFSDSLGLIRKNCILPGVIGRTCTHPCESACVRKDLDGPLSIRLLKRAAADFERKEKSAPLPVPSGAKDGKVAVIGSGPAGLAAAYNLRRKGYGVTVFETLPEAGGMAAVGIPDYRLPLDILRHEIGLIGDTGVEIALNTGIGKIDMDDFRKKGYQALFLAVGAHAGNRMGVKGEETKCDGLVDGVEFLRDLNLGKKIAPKKKVLIIGGGNVAIDCARSCVRLGFKDVEILYRRSRAEMPARLEEIEGAEEEGVKIRYLTAPLEVVSKSGKFSCLNCIRMKLGKPDESGRKRPEPVKGSEHVVEADLVISAIGQSAVIPVTASKKSLSVNRNGTVKVDPKTMMTSVEGIFSGGDCVTGPATLIEAIAAGNRAAEGIDRYLRGEAAGGGLSFEGVDLKAQRAGGYVVKEGAETVPFLEMAKRTTGFGEVEGGFSHAGAMEEAKRCLRCYRVAVWEKGK